MSLTLLTVPKRNQVNLAFNGPWLPPPDGCEGFSTFSSWGSALGNGYSRLVASGSNYCNNATGVGAYYNIDIVNVTDDTFYGAYHAAGTTGGHGTTASILAVGTGAFITDDALNFKLIGSSTMSAPIGMISVDLDGSTTFNGGNTIALTINNDGYIGAHSGVTQKNAWEKFSVGMGVSWLSPVSGGIPASDGYYAVTDETDTKYNAFQNDSDYFLSRRWSHNTTDGTYNYTVMSGYPKSGSGFGLQLYKWQPATIGGMTFTQTNYSLTLSDGTDDTLFQDFVVFNGVKGGGLEPIGTAAYAVSVKTNNQNTQIAGGILANPTVTAQTMFCFAPDYSWYDRIDITSDGTLSVGIVFLDLLGNYFMVGIDGDGAAKYSLPSSPAPVDSAALRAWRFPQDNHEFYVVQLGGLTLVYDKLSDMWAQWKSPDFDYFRGADGCAWKGINVCCDTESSKVWQIDPTGRLDYGTTPITSTIFAGLTERFRTFVPCYMAELAVSEGQPPTGIDAGTVGLQLRSGDGLTWYDHGVVPGEAIGTSVTVRWYGIGLMQSPGKIFEITDTGYARCISGFTIETGTFDIATKSKYKSDETTF